MLTLKRVLVVDNEPSIREIAKVCLERLGGWEVLLASSGQECLTQAKTENPDVILMDLMMPNMDGLTTFDKLQEHPSTQKIPVILLTASIQGDDDHRYREMGLAGAIAKPFDPLELSERVALTLGWTEDTSN
jgi:CheY-like chemotaxis protein